MGNVLNGRIAKERKRKEEDEEVGWDFLSGNSFPANDRFRQFSMIN